MKLSLFGTTRHSGALVINHLSIIHRKENDYQKMPLFFADPSNPPHNAKKLHNIRNI
jgi:hypothetical protein